MLGWPCVDGYVRIFKKVSMISIYPIHRPTSPIFISLYYQLCGRKSRTSVGKQHAYRVDVALRHMLTISMCHVWFYQHPNHSTGTHINIHITRLMAKWALVGHLFVQYLPMPLPSPMSVLPVLFFNRSYLSKNDDYFKWNGNLEIMIIIFVLYGSSKYFSLIPGARYRPLMTFVFTALS